MSDLQTFMFYDKYSRWNGERRETWTEAVIRVVDYLMELSDNKLPNDDYIAIYDAILRQEVMPSMRLLASAGPQARRNPISIYNCAFVGIDSPESFAEALYVSMSGCGVGFSVEKKHTDRLPQLPPKIREVDREYVVEDSAEGWYAAVLHQLKSLYSGELWRYDLSNVRPKGAVLKTKGGRASGPEPLQRVLNHIENTFISYYDSDDADNVWVDPLTDRLSSLDLFDIMCHVGDCAVSGGVRRTAMLCLFDPDDDEMKKAKVGKFPQVRHLSNNSMVWPENISFSQFTEWMGHLFKYDNGEYSAWNPKAVSGYGRDITRVVGVNPCGEINLRHMQFCNLSSVVCRSEDTKEDLARKVEIATKIGTIQSMATNFPLLRPEWKANCEEERLLGVDLNGIMDCPLIIEDDGLLLIQLRQIAEHTNYRYAQLLGIGPSTAITCVKPNGNSSELLGCSSGMKPREARYYIRRVRVSATSPVYRVLFEAGVPLSPENGQTWENLTTAVATFYCESPEGSKLQSDFTAVQMCDFWLKLKKYWTHHNPSVTIRYTENEKRELFGWLWENRDYVGGMTFLPVKQTFYEQAPLEGITESEYNEAIEKYPTIHWDMVGVYELEDMTTSAMEPACVGGACEIL